MCTHCVDHFEYGPGRSTGRRDALQIRQTPPHGGGTGRNYNDHLQCESSLIYKFTGMPCHSIADYAMLSGLLGPVFMDAYIRNIVLTLIVTTNELRMW